MKYVLLLCVLTVTLVLSAGVKDDRDSKFLYVTVATKETDGFRRFRRTANAHHIKVKVLGMGDQWLGGDMNHPGGGHKVRLLREELRKHKDEKDLIVVFSDSYDVIVSGGESAIVKAFKSFRANVVFSTEDFCWPDTSLKDAYPVVFHGYRYLNSGAFIGYAPELYKLVSSPIKNSDDDQLFYTRQFLNESLRHKLKIKLDTQANIFQNLHGSTKDITLDLQSTPARVTNTAYQTQPLILHGNGPSKKTLNSLANYLPQAWDGSDAPIQLDELNESDYPKVLIGFFNTQPTPFIADALEKISNLNYPKKKIVFYIHNTVPSQEKEFEAWVGKQQDDKYAGIKYMDSNIELKNVHAKTQAIERCVEVDCDVYFNVDSEVHLDNPDVLRLLISYNRPVITPIITQYNKLWSTFWGDVTSDGFYARSDDYRDIVTDVKKNIWNVPYIYAVYVIKRSVIDDEETKPNYIYKLQDQDIAFTTNLRKQNVFMYATNLEYYGHLVQIEAVSTEHLHNDLWQVAANQYDWEKKYLHPEYYKHVAKDFTNEMPCPDVYWYPLFNEKFCAELIETMENFGEWSGGKNDDARLDGGYENVPTDDIHMNQIGYKEEWLYILKTYIKPMAEKIFMGYSTDAKAIMNFVVRYKPTKQSFLRPHHDSSTYTINVSLNRYKIDYEGGGSNFIRQDCAVSDTRLGWTIMHPGRLTHYHEGLPTTNGTRYIAVSFIDP